MKIYSKNSEEARLADCRIRIKRDEWPQIPSENMDLIYQLEESNEDIPEEAIAVFSYFDSNAAKTLWFWTDAFRLEKYFNKNPASWTSAALEKIFEEESKIWKEFFAGEVYEAIVENWNPEKRMFEIDCTYGSMYGASEVICNLDSFIEDNEASIICTDDDLLCLF